MWRRPKPRGSRGYTRAMRRLDSLLLTGVGVLLVHQSAYTVSSLAGYKTAVSHGHLEAAWLLGSLTSIGALARAVTQSLRRRRHETDRLSVLATWILLGYLVLEATERMANGLPASSLLAEPVFWFGLVFAPLIALTLHWSMRTVAQLVADAVCKLAAVNPTPVRGSSLEATSVLLPATIVFSFAVSRRGPPTVSHA